MAMVGKFWCRNAWRRCGGALLAAGMLGCSATSPPKASVGHLEPPAVVQEDIPQTVGTLPVLPPPRPQPRQQTYTVVVSEVPVKQLLFSLARDAQVNIDIYPNIEGVVTLNAVEQTLPQILDRIAKQVSLRYQLDGTNLVISADTPYWHTYAVNYVNMARDSEGEVSVATQIATTGGSVSAGGGGTQGNVSKTKVVSTSSNRFWALIEANIKSMLDAQGATAAASIPAAGAGAAGSASASAPAAGSAGTTAPSSQLLVNPVSGTVSVMATRAQHQQIQTYLDQVLASALRQVLIEMTIVEVELGDRYQAGVDWQRLASGDGLSILSTLTGANLSTPPVFSLNYSNTASSGSSVSTTIRMLETFGDVKVLSSPKIMALNNQTALLKVVDEKVYFTVDLEIEAATDTTPERRTYISEIHTVPVGMVMSVTPQINAEDSVTLNIRPTISRITGFAVDPAPRLASSTFDNLIPEIQVREMESLLQIANNQMVVMGGLMQNKVDQNTSGVPLLSSLPWIGALFSYKNDEFKKTELVIFIRPTVIKGAGVGFALDKYRDYLVEPERTVAKDPGSAPGPARMPGVGGQ